MNIEDTSGIGLKDIENALPHDIYFKDHERATLIKTKSYINQIFQDACNKGPLRIGGHGLDHWTRVAYLAGNIAILEKVSPYHATLAGLQHDVGRVIDDPRAHNKLHGQLSAEIIANFVDGLKGVSRDEKNLILTAIEDHPLLNHEVRETELIKVLMDADRIDGMGANMVVRSTAMNWQLPCYAEFRSGILPQKQKGTIFHSIEWVSEWYDMMWTETGKKLALPRIKFMKLFGKEYLKEGLFFDGCAKRLGF